MVSASGPAYSHPAVHENSEPEPDAFVPYLPKTQFAKRIPEAADAGWVIEVSDSTLSFDLRTKARLYARAGVKDYWVLDLVNRGIVVHRQPSFHGYDSVEVYRDPEPVAPLIAPDKPVHFGELTGL